MKVKEIRELSEMELRFQLAVNKLDNPTRIGAVKKEIAIVKTVQRERELAADNK